MKKLNKKGFTLVELLAVITIMGILMIVAIPAVSRTIENSRRNTMASTIGNYISAVRTAVQSDELTCNSKSISTVGAGTYYVNITEPGDWLETGGTSPWSNGTIKGYIAIEKSTTTNNTTKYVYKAYLNDGTHGLKAEKPEKEITRANIAVSGATNPAAKTGTSVCTLTT